MARNRKYAIAKIGKRFVLMFREAGHSYWTQWGTADFDNEIQARKHAAVSNLILE